MSTIYSTWCSCAPGLELLLGAELAALGLAPKSVEPGGVAAAMTPEQLYAAHLHLRVASRVTVRIGRFHASEFWELEKRAERLAWHAWVAQGATVAFRVTCRKSRLYHQDAIVERLGALVAAKVPGVSVVQGAGEDDDTADDAASSVPQLFVVRVVNDEVTISANASGDLLYRRGWRQETAKAPLRETLAAAMLTASGWQGDAPLHDPFCGAGTIVIEAARRAAGIPPGWDRAFAFERWPTFDAARWQAVRAAAAPPPLPPARGRFVGSDRDPGAIRAALGNARRAGVADLVQFGEADIRDLPPAEGVAIVTNPPYGVRVGEEKELAPLFRALGRLGEARGASLTFLSPDAELTAAVGVPSRTAWRTTNGGIPVECRVTGPSAITFHGRP